MSDSPNEVRIEVADRVALRVLTWSGEGQSPFMLVHGLASNCRTWEAVADRLARLGHPVAAVDLRGHGHSDKPDDGYDFATLCSDLAVCLDNLGWSQALVAGQSLGGNLVVELGLRSPDRVIGIVGVDGGGIELARRWPAWDACAKKLAPPRLGGMRSADFDTMLRRAHPSWSDQGIQATMANFEQRTDGTMWPWLTMDRHMSLLRALWEHRPSVELPKLSVPTMLVLAAGDGPGDEEAKREQIAPVVKEAPRVRLQWFSPADHDIHVQKPKELAELMHEVAETWRT